MLPNGHAPLFGLRQRLLRPRAFSFVCTLKPAQPEPHFWNEHRLQLVAACGRSRSIVEQAAVVPFPRPVLLQCVLTEAQRQRLTQTQW